MPSLDPGDVPAEGFAAMNAELAEPSPDVEEYTKASYRAVDRRASPPSSIVCYAGPHQGTAMADALFGVANPGGKLPVTLPWHVGRCRSTTASTPAAATGGPTPTSTMATSACLPPRCSPSGTASATRPSTTALQLERDAVDVGGEARLSLTITNTGSRRGTEVVQLYAAERPPASRSPPSGWSASPASTWSPGDGDRLVRVPMSLFAYTGLSGEFVMEPDPVEVSAGSSSSDLRSSATFTVTGRRA